MKNETRLTPARGCVTPKVIASLKESVDEESGEGEERDYTAIDGYDEIPENFQEKFRKALEQGHVDDSDWNGVCFLFLLLSCLGVMHANCRLQGCRNEPTW